MALFRLLTLARKLFVLVPLFAMLALVAAPTLPASAARHRTTTTTTIATTTTTTTGSSADLSATISPGYARILCCADRKVTFTATVTINGPGVAYNLVVTDG
jgi:hypothetical protein